MRDSGVSTKSNEAAVLDRVRVTRELHDIEHSLAILAVQMMRAGKSVSGLPGMLHPGSGELASKLKEIAGRVGHLSRWLHSSAIERIDLAEAVQRHCQDVSKKFHIPVECCCREVPACLDSMVALSMFRVLQEALRNATSHGNAKHIQVDLQGSPKELRLLVADDGVGCNIDEAWLAAGLGLISMRERIHLHGGEFQIQSKPGEGTRIGALVPVTQEMYAKSA